MAYQRHNKWYSDAKIEGLDLVLGGGIVSVPKVDMDTQRSTVVLIRGGPGTGKTIFGSHIAIGLARDLTCDILYACIELLPTELKAQLDDFHFNRDPVTEPDIDNSAKIILPRAHLTPESSAQPRVLAGLLNLGENPQEGLVLAIEESILQLSPKGYKIGVIVIDSVSDGYGIGPSVPREVADGVAKLAADQGLIAVILEETLDDRPSSWSFAADTVLELSHIGTFSEPARERRQLTVRKHRCAPSHIGPHTLIVQRGSGIHVYPRPSAYLTYWAEELLFGPAPRGLQHASSWGLQGEDLIMLPPIHQSAVAIYGPDAVIVKRVALAVGVANEGVDIFVNFGALPTTSSEIRDDERAEKLLHIPAQNPWLGSEFFLAKIREIIEGVLQSGRSIRRVLVGDLRALRSHLDPDGLRLAIASLPPVVRRINAPLILFETSEETDTGGRVRVIQPSIIDSANVLLQIESRNQGKETVVVTNTVTGFKKVFSIST